MVSKKQPLHIAFFIALLIITSIGCANAIGIIGELRTTVVYAPGLEKTFEYQIVPDETSTLQYDVYPLGVLAKYVYVTPKSIDLRGGGSGYFSATVRFPEMNMEPGLHEITIAVEEINPHLTGGIDSKASIKPTIFLKALFPDKKIGVEFEFSNSVRIDKTANVNVIIDGWGEEVINELDATVEIYNLRGQLVDTIIFDDVTLEPGAKHTFSKEWSPRDAGIVLTNDAEDFKAVAIVTYDGVSETAEQAFEVTTDLMVIKEKPSYSTFLIVIAALAIALIGAFVYILRTKRRKSDDE